MWPAGTYLKDGLGSLIALRSLTNERSDEGELVYVNVHGHMKQRSSRCPWVQIQLQEVDIVDARIRFLQQNIYTFLYIPIIRLGREEVSTYLFYIIQMVLSV